MMIKIQRYRCEYCDNEFFDERSCQSCEDSHAKIKEIEKKSYQHGGKYPQYLEVRMDDGSLVIYTKSNIAKE